MGDDETSLMRVECKDSAAAQFAWPSLDLANHGIPIFDRKREYAGHKGSAHTMEFTFGHAAGKYQAFSAATERAVQRPHSD